MKIIYAIVAISLFIYFDYSIIEEHNYLSFFGIFYYQTSCFVVFRIEFGIIFSNNALGNCFETSIIVFKRKNRLAKKQYS